MHSTDVLQPQLKLIVTSIKTSLQSKFSESGKGPSEPNGQPGHDDEEQVDRQQHHEHHEPGEDSWPIRRPQHYGSMPGSEDTTRTNQDNERNSGGPTNAGGKASQAAASPSTLTSSNPSQASPQLQDLLALTLPGLTLPSLTIPGLTLPASVIQLFQTQVSQTIPNLSFLQEILPLLSELFQDQDNLSLPLLGILQDSLPLVGELLQSQDNQTLPFLSVLLDILPLISDLFQNQDKQSLPLLSLLLDSLTLPDPIYVPVPLPTNQNLLGSGAGTIKGHDQALGWPWKGFGAGAGRPGDDAEDDGDHSDFDEFRSGKFSDVPRFRGPRPDFRPAAPSRNLVNINLQIPGLSRPVYFRFPDRGHDPAGPELFRPSFDSPISKTTASIPPAENEAHTGSIRTTMILKTHLQDSTDLK